MFHPGATGQEMSYRIEYVGDPTRQRQPRREDLAKLQFIRLLSCAICARRPVEAAHLRIHNRLLGKRQSGTAEKPDDIWTLPLCGGPEGHHAEQHRIGDELRFWASHNIANPFQFALALHAAYDADDLERANSIVAEHRHLCLGLG